jgi:hypothetical protein
MHEVIGNLHMHTPYSDGEKYHAAIAEDAIAAGLDFVIVTDHNVWVDGVEGYYENANGRVLLLTGEEVHNVRRRPQASHFLAYGVEKELFPYAADPQALIDATNEAGGYGFLAHPHERDLPTFNEPNYGWHDWEIDGFSGLEIWNYMSCFKSRMAEAIDRRGRRNGLLAKLTAVRVALNPQKYITGPEAETLALWDDLLAQGKRVAAIGNSDAHGTPMRLGPLKRVIFPYDFLFRAVNTHVLLREPLTGEPARDKQIILRAVGRGNSWVGYDMAHPTRGFRFSGHGRTKGVMGDDIEMDVGATLQVVTPAKANMRVLRHGEVVATAENSLSLTHTPLEPGAYRVECAIPYMGRLRGWIYSNPIYLH